VKKNSNNITISGNIKMERKNAWLYNDSFMCFNSNRSFRCLK
jgi:hypothetical protein